MRVTRRSKTAGLADMVKAAAQIAVGLGAIPLLAARVVSETRQREAERAGAKPKPGAAEADLSTDVERRAAEVEVDADPELQTVSAEIGRGETGPADTGRTASRKRPAAPPQAAVENALRKMGEVIPAKPSAKSRAKSGAEPSGKLPAKPRDRPKRPANDA